MAKQVEHPISGKKKSDVFEQCPHCGQPLSPWEQVLLSVDRALMCKHCWYRIILDVLEDTQERSPRSKE